MKTFTSQASKKASEWNYWKTSLSTAMKKKSAELAQKIINNVSGGISRETKFHLAELTQEKLMWNYTYSNGNTDTWTFYRQEK